MNIQKIRGFTLIEVMVVVAIVGILAALVMPSYQDSVRKSRRSDGQAALMEMASRMESFYYTNKGYTTDLTALGYSDADKIASPEGFYVLAVSEETVTCPIATCFELVASAQAVQVNDGDLTLDSLGQKLPADKW